MCIAPVAGSLKVFIPATVRTFREVSTNAFDGGGSGGGGERAVLKL